MINIFNEGPEYDDRQEYDELLEEERMALAEYMLGRSENMIGRIANFETSLSILTTAMAVASATSFIYLRNARTDAKSKKLFMKTMEQAWKAGCELNLQATGAGVTRQ